MYEIPEAFLNNNYQKKSERDRPRVSEPFADCVMWHKRGQCKWCDALTEMFCQTRGECKFYKNEEDIVNEQLYNGLKNDVEELI